MACPTYSADKKVYCLVQLCTFEPELFVIISNLFILESIHQARREEDGRGFVGRRPHRSGCR